MTSLLSRSEAGLRSPRCVSHSISPTTITLHYGGPTPWSNADVSTAETFRDSTDHNRCASIWRAWQAYHMDAKGWCDVAYNSAVCPHGVRYEGRGPGVRSGAQGTNAGNGTSYAVVYIAGGDDPLTDEAKLAFLDEQDRYGVPLRWPHHHWHSTSCPGRVDDWIDVGFQPPAGGAPAPGDPPTLPPTAPGALPWWWQGRNLSLRSPMMRGDDVGWAQHFLWLHGHGGADANGEGDGIFGPATRAAVISFQRERGLSADGIIGPNTARALGG